MVHSLLEGATAYVGFDVQKESIANYFLCDGTADDVQINAAEAYVTALGGGTVELEEGTYVLAAGGEIVPTGGGVWYKGQGRETFINGDALLTTQHVFHITGRDDIRISDMSIQTQDGGTKTCHCIFIEDGSDRFRIENVIVIDSDSDGIHVEGTNISEGWITNCDVLDVDDNGIHVIMDGVNYMDYLHVTDCTVTSAGLGGIIFAFRARYSTISDSIIDSSGSFGIEIAEGSISNLVIGCSSSNNGQSGINIDTASSNIVENNIFYNNTVHGILLDSVAYNNLIKGNYTYDNSQCGINVVLDGSDDNVLEGNYVWANTTHGIRVNAADNTRILGNYIWDNSRFGTNTYDGISIEDDADNTTIMNNVIRIPRHEYGVDITTADCDGTLVMYNDLRNSGATNMIRDLGTGTILPTGTFQFTEAVNGAIVTTSPTGVDVDATTEAALAWGQLPLEVQQVVRLKIWAVATDAPIGAGGQMHLEVTFNAGASNAAYNEAAKSWNIASFDGEETDYVASDVVHWVIEDGDVGNELANLVAGDSFEIFAIWETGADPDGATDARFRIVEIEYV